MKVQRSIFGIHYVAALLLTLMIWIGASSFTNPFIFDSKVTAAKVTKVYPNPAISFINFEFADAADKGFTIQLYSFIGRKMYEQPVNANKLTITLSSDFYRGIYIYHLRDKTGQLLESGKFQVAR
ncbi:MAG: T9SS type A sorting domain-containing protein [Chitinophagaceae bacterium]